MTASCCDARCYNWVVIPGLGGKPHEAAGIHHPCRWRGAFASRQTRRLPATVCILIPMDWFILILGVPAILIPLVLLFGFAGCQLAGLCTGDEDCPGGLVCVQGACVDPGVDQPNPSPSPPENLAAIALDDQSVSLTWTNNDPAATDISFQIEHTPENGEPEVFTAQANLSPPARPARRILNWRRASHSYTAFGRCWERNAPTSRTGPGPRSFPQPR
jgi:hypothetical protein